MQEVFSTLFHQMLGGAEPNIFFELAIILLASGIIAYIAYFLKQPSIIAYIVVGLIIGPLGFYHLRHSEIMEGLSTIGITLLLFMVGLDLDISQLKRIGKSAVMAGIGQVIFTFLLGFALVYWLGMETVPALYIAVALTFSSTIIVIKLLNEKKDMQSLYGKLAIGVFLIQDIAAVFILILLSSFTGIGKEGISTLVIANGILMMLVKIFMSAVIVMWLSKHVFPRIIRTIDRSDELILLFSLGWSLGLAAVFSLPGIGFNPAIGGFAAGIALANTGVQHQISSRIKSLRDFFIIIFFIILGSQLVLQNIGAALIPAIWLSAFVLIGKPLIVLIILSFMGHKPRTSFMAGVTVAQVSEFSLILMALGLSAGHIEQIHLTIITLVAIATISLSSYGIIFADTLYRWIQKPLQIFDFNKSAEEKKFETQSFSNHIVLVGAHRLGSHIMDAMGKNYKDLLVIDFDPDVAHKYNHFGINTICGDIGDPYIQDVASLEKAKLIISTVPDFYDTKKLLEATSLFKKHVRTIVAANNEAEAELLYKAGADYVLLPHFIGGLHLADIIKTDRSTSELKKLRHQHLKSLKYIIKTR